MSTINIKYFYTPIFTEIWVFSLFCAQNIRFGVLKAIKSDKKQEKMPAQRPQTATGQAPEHAKNVEIQTFPHPRRALRSSFFRMKAK
jgi:hypothetical protein